MRHFTFCYCGAPINPAVSIGLVSDCPEYGAVFMDGTDCSAVTEHPDAGVVVECNISVTLAVTGEVRVSPNSRAMIISSTIVDTVDTG